MLRTATRCSSALASQSEEIALRRSLTHMLPSLSPMLRTATRCFSAMASQSEEIALRRGEPLLFTPGPLTTSHAVKAAMQVDLGSRDTQMLDITSSIRQRLLSMAGASDKYDSIIMQGSGSFAVESVISSVVPSSTNGGRLLVLSNGAYGDRIVDMAKRAGIETVVVRVNEDVVVTASHASDALLAVTADVPYTHVAVIHHETTAGVLNPIRDIGQVVREHGRGASFIVDSMSAFGAYEVDMAKDHVDYLVSSANKNIEGVPGFSFAICNRQKLEKEGMNARTVTLDLLGQLKGLNANGQFRFTPPTHALLAFNQALKEHEAEGGPAGRLERYTRNCERLIQEMRLMGFQPYVDDIHRGVIINTFLFPDDKNFNFDQFYRELAARGLVIYPGKLTERECFRIGSIGRLFEEDMVTLTVAIKDILISMGVQLPVQSLQ